MAGRPSVQRILGAFFLAAFFIFATPASATQVSLHSVKIDILPDGVSHINAEIKYADLTTSRISYLVFARIANLAARDPSGPLSCSLARQSYGTEISCTPSNATMKNQSVELSFDAYQIVSPSGTASLLSYNYAVSDPTDMLRVEAVLPEATGIVASSGFESVFPAGYALGSTGRRTTVSWDIQKPDLGKTYAFNVNYEPISAYAINLNYGLIAIIGVLAILVLFFRLRVPAFVVKTVMSVLKPDEKKVIDAITEKGGQCKQRDIVRSTDFSKAKVSRIISDLEARGIIQKIRTGRTNKIQVSKGPAPKPEEKKPA